MSTIPENMWISGNASCDSISELIHSHAGNSIENPLQSQRSIIRLHGREEETSKMKQCFTDVASDGDARLLLVAGVSGSGKSALVEHMRNYVTSTECNGFFCEGKFEQSLDEVTNAPFRALATAFSDVIDFILNQTSEKVEEWSKTVSEALGADAPMLIDIVPNLSLLLRAPAQKTDTAPSCSQEGSTDGEDATTKIHTHLTILFRKFLRSLTSKEAPILLFLDDLQSADKDSLEVFRAIVTDSSLKYVLIVGSYRSNEISMAELLSHSATCGSKSSPFTVPTTAIHVGNLSPFAINAGIAEKLQMDKETTEPLSKVILQKSGGNPFYISQYLSMLQENHLLVYSEEEKRWTWDLDEILMTTNISDNVLELVSQRLRGLTEETRTLLTLVAFLAFTFEVDLIEMILRHQLAGPGSSHRCSVLESQCIVNKAASLLCESQLSSQNLAAIEGVLQEAVAGGLIEKCAGGIFKFTHDRIQQAFYKMVTTESARSALHYKIGHAATSAIDLDNLDGDTGSTFLFFAANHLNRGISLIKDEAETIQLANINLKAGKVAASRAGYRTAAAYLRTAMALLNNVKYWDTQYSLMIDLCSSTAEIEAKISSFELSREACDLVLHRASSLDDTVRAYVCLVSSYCTQGLLDDAVRFGIEFLSQVGVKVPRHATLALVGIHLIKTKMCMYKVTNTMILESPRMPDNNMAIAMEVLSTLATAYFLQGEGEMYGILVLQMVRLTRRFGLSKTSPRIFANYSVLTAMLGDHKLALRYGNLALDLMQAPGYDTNMVSAQVLALLYHFVLWSEIPLQECTNIFLRGVNIGKQQGDLEWAYMSGNGIVNSMLVSGYHLHEILDVAREVCSEMLEYEIYACARGTIPLLQLVENLTSHSENTYKLTGNAMNEEEALREAESSSIEIAVATINVIRFRAAVLFQEWDLASELADSAVKVTKYTGAHFTAVPLRFYLGLTYSEAYIRDGKRKDLRCLLKIIRKLKRYSDVGGNCKPLHLILQAEFTAVTKRHSQVAQKEATKAMYKKAIEQCRIQNLIHYEAIASERASGTCKRHRDQPGAVEFMTHAVDCNRNWGADAKVEQLEEMHFQLLR